MTPQQTLVQLLPSQAIWWKNGDHPQDYVESQTGMEEGQVVHFSPAERRERGWEGDVVRYFRHPAIPGVRDCPFCSYTVHQHGWIDERPHGGVTVCPGDIIETLPDGRHVVVGNVR
jgi:hypothetical protein